MSGSALSQTKDPAIKLFGRIVSIPDIQIPDTLPSKNRCSDITNGEIVNLDENDSGELHKSAATAQAIKDNQTPTESNEVPNSKLTEDQVETSSTEKEKLKKPDKILPCPRCDSLDTKFCYFNNYNVNQPRHFCKNCQRYWTAGGTMRNVPIGAGRRKNKHLASQFRQMLLSSEMPITGMDNSDSESHELISSPESVTNLRLAAPGNGMLLTFSSEEPLCKSVEKELNLGDQTKYADMTPVNTQDNKKEPYSCGSFMAATTSGGSDISESVNHNQPADIVNSSDVIKVPSGHCYPVPPWLFPWNPGWSGPHSTAAAQNPGGKSCVPSGNNVNQVQWCPTPIIAVPGFCPPSIPVQLVPASYLSFMPVFAAGTMSPDGSYTSPSPSSSTSTSCCSGNGSLKLGKHSRDSNLMEEEQAESCVLVPKTLRMDDLNKASKRPLWAATLSPKPEKKIPIAQGLVFKTFDTKAERKSRVTEASPTLEANPAALSRANTFQESS